MSAAPCQVHRERIRMNHGSRGVCGMRCIKCPSPSHHPAPTFPVLSSGWLNPILQYGCSHCNAWGSC